MAGSGACVGKHPFLNELFSKYRHNISAVLQHNYIFGFMIVPPNLALIQRCNVPVSVSVDGYFIKM